MQPIAVNRNSRKIIQMLELADEIVKTAIKNYVHGKGECLSNQMGNLRRILKSRQEPNEKSRTENYNFRSETFTEF